MPQKKRKTKISTTNAEILEKEIDSLKCNLSEKTEQAEEYLDHLQRMKAEFENYKKRIAKDHKNMSEYAKQDLILKILDIVDNFDRAVSHTDELDDFKTFLKGILMIQNQLHDLLSSEGVKAIDAVGNPFDPTKHEAVICVATDEHPDNIVIDELKKGYMIKERVIRPSMVKVSKNEC